MKYLPFDEARKFARKLGLKSQSEWKKYSKSEKIPVNIPKTPERVYRKSSEWDGWGDWLGTGRIANQNKEYRSFFESREFVRGLKLRTGKEWKTYCKTKEKPDDIPNAPWHVYRAQWKNLVDWLGTKPSYIPFVEARKFVHRLGLKATPNGRSIVRAAKSQTQFH